MKNCSNQKIDTIRMKDIVSQFADVIYLLCEAKEKDVMIILNQLTNLTPEEKKSLHIEFPHECEGK